MMQFKISNMKIKKAYLVTILAIAGVGLFAVAYAFTSIHFFGGSEAADNTAPYLKFLERVYTEMEQNYYKPVSAEIYEQFKKTYTKDVLTKIRDKSHKDVTIAHLGAGLLVTKLRDPEDIFTNFIPPKIAVEYSKEIYSYENGIGIEGTIIPGYNVRADIFMIDHVQLRSNAYLEGIRAGNIIIQINDIPISELNKKKIHELLYPPIDTTVKLLIANPKEKKVVPFTLVCTEYFKETITEIPTGMPGVTYLTISTFNKETANDLKNILKERGPENIKYLVLDVTGNPGGPPLAVRELSGIFLPPGERLFYYQKRNTPEFGLTSPNSDVRYNGRLVVVIDKKSGSSSELLAGTLKAYKRAIIVGKEATAGFAFLKGTKKFEDGSMLAMVTGVTYLFDGTMFGLEGVAPSYKIPHEIKDIRRFVLDNVTV